MIKKIFLKLITIYQKYISILSPKSCRYYPTCSEYAKWRIENENILKAIFFIAFRVLRCNQLFKGGIEYPIVSKKIEPNRYKKIDIKYWFIPDKENRFIVIKNFKN